MTALVVCNGKPLNETDFKKFAESCDVIIAADGGAKTALQYGIQPDYITGDMDSFDASEGVNSVIISDADQETNDLEKALNLALEKGIDEVFIVGATGQRTDHTLKNLSVQLQFLPKFRLIKMIDDIFEYDIITRSLSKSINIGTVISLFPLSGRVDGITTKGLKYPLNNEPLENGVRDGSSNEAVSEKIEISISKGALLVMTARP